MGNNKNNKTANKNANKKTLQEWRAVFIKLHNAMANANRQHKWARRDKFAQEHIEASMKATQQHGVEAVKGLMGRGITLTSITKEEYEEAQAQNNTKEKTFAHKNP
tara:strand:- start:1376 stop:1693 length:318 start_codon:yes stop_codon:yes gene_type:complete